MLALAVDLIWGYCGILSLGHAAFFSLGGYAMGMYLMRQIGPRGVYGDPILPDFMVFLNWKSLPWFWYGFNHFSFALLMMVLVPALLALVFGWFAFRSRVTGVYLSIITQALTYALMLAFFRNDMGFGGNNGFTDFKDILGFDLHSDRTRVVLLVITAVALAASYLACRAIVESRAGRVMRAIRDAESRTRFLGYPVESFKLWVFVFSAVIAGIAGALYVPQVGIINPERVRADQFDRSRHLGGGRRPRHALRRDRRRGAGELREDLSSPARFPKSGSTRSARLFVLVTLFLPRGIIGLVPARSKRQMSVARQAALSRGPDRQLRRLQGAQRAHAVRRPGRAALHHRPQRRRQDHHDGRHHRQDAPGFRDGVVRRRHRSAQVVRAGNRRGRHRPEVSEADRVRAVDRVRESRAGAGRQPVVPENAARPHHAGAARANRRGARDHRPRGAARVAGQNPRARPEAVARNRHAADAESGTAAGGRAGGRHDAAGDRAHGRAAAVAGGRALGRGGRARHGVRSVDRQARHGAARRTACIAEGDMDKVQNDPRVIEVYLGV